jgi:hypothetical protein
MSRSFNFDNQLDANETSYTVYPDNHGNRMVNWPPVNFSGNMGSNQIPTSEPSSVFTGGARKTRKKRCKPLKIKNVNVLYKKHNIMTPQKDIRLVKKQLMALTEVSFPPFSRKRTKRSMTRKSKTTKKKSARKHKKSSKKRKSMKMRGGTTTVGYSTPVYPLSSSELALANPAPFQRVI